MRLDIRPGNLDQPPNSGINALFPRERRDIEDLLRSNKRARHYFGRTP